MHAVTRIIFAAVPQDGATSRAEQVPPAEVLTAFGLGDVTLLPLAGGQRIAWRAGAVVLKPLDTDLTTLAWIAEITSSLDGRSDFRVAPPVPADSGALAVHGWTAWRYEPGKPLSQSWRHSVSWRDVIDVADAFHRAVAAFPRPSFLDERRDRWALADRIAWGSHDEPWGLALGRKRASLQGPFTVMSHTQPIEATSQLIHGDLSGNVLFVSGEPPCIIDFSPYWRPATAAVAAIVIDAVTFHRQGPSLIESQMYRQDFGQFLLRALVFRMVADAGEPGADLRSDRDDPYLRTLETVLSVIQRQAGR